MYIIKRKGCIPKVLKNAKFKTYEEARKAVRAWLYRMFKLGKVRRFMDDSSNRTATISKCGFVS